MLPYVGIKSLHNMKIYLAREDVTYKNWWGLLYICYTLKDNTGWYAAVTLFATGTYTIITES